MHDACIVCVRKDWQGVITHVGIGGRFYEVMHIDQDLLEKHYSLYTAEKNSAS